MAKEEHNSKGYGPMKKFLTRLFVIATITGATISAGYAKDYLTIKSSLSGGGTPIEINLLDNGGDFYQLDILINNSLRASNDKLIPTKSINNPGGLDIFRGIGIANDNLMLNFYFCSPSIAICYDRHIVIGLSDEQPSVTREEVTAFSGNLSATGAFYNTSPIPLASASYQYFLENNDRARNMFIDKYGECISNIGGDSVLTILDELERPEPSDWLFKKNCITSLLVLELKNQKSLSEQAAKHYFESLNE